MHASVSSPMKAPASDPGLAATRRRNTGLDIMERLRAQGEGMTFNAMLVFMYVSENEGINVTDLARMCRMTEATASRSARALATADSPSALPPSLGLLELRQDPYDGRGRMVYLTALGKKLAGDIDASIRNAITIAD